VSAHAKLAVGTSALLIQPPAHHIPSPMLAHKGARTHEPPAPPPARTTDSAYATEMPWIEERDDPKMEWVRELGPDTSSAPPLRAMSKRADMTSETLSGMANMSRPMPIWIPPTQRDEAVRSDTPSSQDMIRHLKRMQWATQREHEQRLQREPWRRQRPADHEWTVAQARATLSAPVTLRGEIIDLPPPSVPIFDAFRETSRAATAAPLMPRTPMSPRRLDGGRWPPGPPNTAPSEGAPGSTGRGMLDKMVAGAASSLAVGPFPPTAPAGMVSLADAQRLGAAYVRALFPRPNVVGSLSGSGSPRAPSRRDGARRTVPHVEVQPAAFPSAIFSTESVLGDFLGRSSYAQNTSGSSGSSDLILGRPMASQAPIFDPRLARASSPPISPVYHSSPRAQAKPRSYGASPRNMPTRQPLAHQSGEQLPPAYRHTAEYMFGPLV